MFSLYVGVTCLADNVALIAHLQGLDTHRRYVALDDIDALAVSGDQDRLQALYDGGKDSPGAVA